MQSAGFGGETKDDMAIWMLSSSAAERIFYLRINDFIQLTTNYSHSSIHSIDHKKDATRYMIDRIKDTYKKRFSNMIQIIGLLNMH